MTPGTYWRSQQKPFRPTIRSLAERCYTSGPVRVLMENGEPCEKVIDAKWKGVDGKRFDCFEERRRKNAGK